jgi:hypothetical protein
LKRILTLIIKRAKGFELMNFSYIFDLNTFDFKRLLTLKIMNSENVFLAKIVHVYVIEGMNA